MNSLNNLKSALKAVSQQYADDFCAGWRNAALGDSVERTRRVQDENHSYWTSRNLPERVTTGMVDGCIARHEIFPE